VHGRIIAESKSRRQKVGKCILSRLQNIRLWEVVVILFVDWISSESLQMNYLQHFRFEKKSEQKKVTGEGEISPAMS
jgi:hypothetical protein